MTVKELREALEILEQDYPNARVLHFVHEVYESSYIDAELPLHIQKFRPSTWHKNEYDRVFTDNESEDIIEGLVI